MSKLYKNVIFDFGNVLVQWQPFNALSHLFDDETQMTARLTEIGFFDWNIEQDRGRNVEDGLKLVAERPDDERSVFESYIENIAAAHKNQVPGTAQILNSLHSNNVATYGLSNAPEIAFETVQQTVPEITLMENITISARVGLVKPDVRIFKHCLAENKIDPSETVFVDDSAANCATAEALGIRSHQFVDAERLDKWLQGMGLLDAV
ncbi:MAG: HAD family phosphatase [Pseudomonadota bacterium]